MEVKKWNQFVLDHGPASGRFLQSWQWGEFQKVLGAYVNRELFERNHECIGAAQWIERKIPGLGTYRFCPKGPIMKSAMEKMEIKKEDNEIFVRVEPASVEGIHSLQKTTDISPRATLITDLSKSENELMSAMHSKTRYNINVAKRHGVEIILRSSNLEEVWSLFKQTAARGDFRLHPKRYYEKMLQALHGTSCDAFIAIAMFESKPVCATIIVDFGNTRTYLHGASSNEHRQMKAPHLLHWELMRDAKAKGFLFYDWWGVAPQHAPNHPWEGISRFKRGFGGEEIESPGTYDVVLSPMRYRVYSLGRGLVRSIYKRSKEVRFSTRSSIG